MTNKYDIIIKNTQLAVVNSPLLTLFSKSVFVIISTLSISLLFMANASAVVLQSLDYSSLPGNKTQITATFSEFIDQPSSFSIEQPARIVLDFAGVQNHLDKRTKTINSGVIRSVSTVEARDRTRMVINLSQQAPYTIKHDGNVVLVTIDGASSHVTKPSTGEQKITDINFRRGDKGEARLIISISERDTALDVRQEQEKIIVVLTDVLLPENLHRRLDVIDFATPVQLIDSEQIGANTRLTLSTKGTFEHLAYQTEDAIVIDVIPIAQETRSSTGKTSFTYKGEKVSLNFQNVEIRAVLQVLAGFIGMNLVVSDTVQGNVTLKLKNVPWDQALDIILKTKGLAKRESGNVLLIAPAAEIAAQERQELEAKQQLIALEPLYSEVFEINFAKASELERIISNNTSNSDSLTTAGGVIGFISARGSITVDDRTNSLLIRDTAEQLIEIRNIIEILDKPIRQVLIESRIVIANDNFAKDLGVKFGVSKLENANSSFNVNMATSGTLNGTSQLLNGDALNQTDRLNVNLPVANAAGSIALALAKLPYGAILELELSAMQQEGKGDIISSPRVITSNQQEAIIEQGTEIPYQEASSSGSTSVSFKSATLKLSVTPQITPDDHIIMDLEVHKDQVGGVYNGIPSIDTRRVKTQVIVANGETVVLGGIYEHVKRDGSTRIPFFGDLPYVGFLFKSTTHTDNKSELLIFITPKIIKDSLQF